MKQNRNMMIDASGEDISENAIAMKASELVEVNQANIGSSEDPR